MRAIVQCEYGLADEVLSLRDIDEPVVGDDELLVRIHAASANPSDWHAMTGLPYVSRFSFGLLKPKVSGLGADLAGVVRAVGRDVGQFQVGDAVYGQVNGEVPGKPLLELASFAEYVSVVENSVAHMPANLTFEQAAAVPMAGMTALQALRDQGRIEPGNRVLINGASGGVGTFAVQIAKSFGAEVAGVCSTQNVEMVRSLGADVVLDYTQEDFTTMGRLYDLILDNVGNHSPLACRRALKANGVYVASFGRPDHRWVGPAAQLLKAMAISPLVSQDFVVWEMKRKKGDLIELKELIEAGKVTPVIDRVYPLTEVPAAMRYLERGHAKGKVVIRC